uniref:Uncharacterized protein n=1 Tax=Strombidium inclinatum TaxID=197538 RepID=A0A7S3IMC6_9SPIT
MVVVSVPDFASIKILGTAFRREPSFAVEFHLVEPLLNFVDLKLGLGSFLLPLRLVEEELGSLVLVFLVEGLMILSVEDSKVEVGFLHAQFELRLLVIDQANQHLHELLSMRATVSRVSRANVLLY